MRKEILHTAAEWEKNKPSFATYNRMQYNDDGKTIKMVQGTVEFMHRSSYQGDVKYVRTDRPVRWDAQGHCTMSTHNERKRQFDIIFREDEPERTFTQG